MSPRRFSRRAFLKTAGLAGLASLVPPPDSPRRYASRLVDRAIKDVVLPPGEWPAGVPLGRGALGWGAPILSRPHPDGTQLGYVYPDDVVRIHREVVGLGMAYHSHVWFELDEGFVYAPHIQPVFHLPQPALEAITGTTWGEVVTPWHIPYVRGNAGLVESTDFQETLYYSMVYGIAEVFTGPDGQPWYRATTETGLNFHAPASIFRIITPEEVTPLSPEVDPAEKKMVVSLEDQTLTALEGKREVFRAKISSGANYLDEDGVTVLNGTPLGMQYPWNKRFARHMVGGTTGAGYDIPGIGWVMTFNSNGAAVHSTFWHNDFGIPKSHGCLNCRPQDAKWLFRWASPSVPYDVGEAQMRWPDYGTIVEIQA